MSALFTPPSCLSPAALPVAPAGLRPGHLARIGLITLGLCSTTAWASVEDDSASMRRLDDTPSFEYLAARPESDVYPGKEDSWATLAGHRSEHEAEHDDDHEDWHPDWHEDRHDDHFHHEDHIHTQPIPEADSYLLLLLGLLGLAIRPNKV